MSLEHAAHSNDASSIYDSDHAPLHGIPAPIEDAQHAQAPPDAKTKLIMDTLARLLAKGHYSDIDRTYLTNLVKNNAHYFNRAYALEVTLRNIRELGSNYPRSSNDHGHRLTEPTSDGADETDSGSGSSTDEEEGVAAIPIATNEHPAVHTIRPSTEFNQEDLQYCLDIGAKFIGYLWGLLCALIVLVRTGISRGLDFTNRQGKALFNSLHHHWVTYQGATEERTNAPVPVPVPATQNDGNIRHNGVTLQREEDPRPVVIHPAEPQVALRRRRHAGTHRSDLPASKLKLEEVAHNLLEVLAESINTTPMRHTPKREPTPFEEPRAHEDFEQHQEHDFTLVYPSASGRVTFGADEPEAPPPMQSLKGKGRMTATAPIAHTYPPRATSAMPGPSASAGPSRYTRSATAPVADFGSRDPHDQLQKDVRNARKRVSYARAQVVDGKWEQKKLDHAERELVFCQDRLEEAKNEARYEVDGNESE
ncbi:hypothetical protein DFP72DRAFT_1059497 [Ephemerocybe angulata]|uniref:Uncharacterized protein n=1 Tax=Ephemerocybe angulata TaxID=980116 RepID=A0A8H6MGC1_9AGAR|nr:hypothetical protein DFP72DRAFT_1059497 [Tulosesus angulatus]